MFFPLLENEDEIITMNVWILLRNGSELQFLSFYLNLFAQSIAVQRQCPMASCLLICKSKTPHLLM